MRAFLVFSLGKQSHDILFPQKEPYDLKVISREIGSVHATARNFRSRKDIVEIFALLLLDRKVLLLRIALILV